MRDLPYRRSQISRLIKNRKNDFYAGESNKQLKIHITTPAQCSCWLCCNPRKRNELTIQERKSNVNYTESLREIEYFK